MSIRMCTVCGCNKGIEGHHIIFRSQVKALEKCKYNIVDLCQDHHKGTFGVHGSKGSNLDKELKLYFQEKLYALFGDKDYYSLEEVKRMLGIDIGQARKLFKVIKSIEDKYFVEDIVRACMGGKIL